MQAVTSVTGTVVPLDRNDVDTDAIIPKQFLKRTERTGYGPFAFFETRYLDPGAKESVEGLEPNPSFPMNQPQYAGGSILVTGKNFGCGSSREHAPWALEDVGFRAIIAPSFADIFRNNCGNVGIVAVVLAEAEVRQLFALVEANPSLEVTVDLQAQTVIADGFTAGFDIDQATKHKLVNGLDAISLTLTDADAIASFESTRPAHKPSVTGV